MSNIQKLSQLLSQFDWQKSILFATDSYKFSHYAQYPDGTEFIHSYIEPRKASNYSNEVILAGVQDCIIKYFAKPITSIEVEAAKIFAEMHGVPFNYEGWMSIVNNFDGFLPIEINALPEGSAIEVKNAVLTITNTVSGYGWLVGWCEPVLLRSVWYKSTVATYSAQIKKTIIASCSESMDMDEIVQTINFAHHDFGSRGVSSGESACIGGSAHAMTSMGSDTVEGILHTIANFSVSDMPCYSVPAAEHSTVTIYLKDGERDAILNMINKFGDKYKIISFVADSYNVRENVKMVVELKDLIKEKGIKFVIRPDSGDAHLVILEIFNFLHSKQLLNRKVFKNKLFFELPDWLGILQGDGVCIDTIVKIQQTLNERNYCLKGLVFGQGGALLQSHSRDDFGWAMKCSYAVINGEGRDVYKDPITDKSKKSKRGLIKLITVNGKYSTILSSEDPNFDSHFNLLTCAYRYSGSDNTVPYIRCEKWAEVKERVNAYIFKGAYVNV